MCGWHIGGQPKLVDEDEDLMHWDPDRRYFCDASWRNCSAVDPELGSWDEWDAEGECANK